MYTGTCLRKGSLKKSCLPISFLICPIKSAGQIQLFASSALCLRELNSLYSVEYLQFLWDNQGFMKNLIIMLITIQMA